MNRVILAMKYFMVIKKMFYRTYKHLYLKLILTLGNSMKSIIPIHGNDTSLYNFTCINFFPQ